MKPVFDAARAAPDQPLKRLVFAEGDHPYVLQAAQQLVAERIARPILIGRRESIVRMLPHLGLRFRPDKDFDIFDHETEKLMWELADEYHRLVETFPPRTRAGWCVTGQRLSAACSCGAAMRTP